MNLHVDVPTRAQIARLLTSRADASVSLYVPTDPAATDDAERIELKNLTTEAVRQLESSDTPKAEIAEIEAAVRDLDDDDEFWRHQARSLAVFVTPQTLTTFRLPNRLVGMVEVSDRFHVKPLLRSVTFPQTAIVLALAQGSVRVLEIVADLEPSAIDVPGLPEETADSPGKSSVRLRQYARRVDEALRPLLNGLDVPLILAAAEPLESIYRSVNSYPHLAPTSVTGNPQRVSDADLVDRARVVLDQVHADELEAVRQLYERRSSEGRATSDIVDVARAATYGAVDTALVDIDGVVPGSIDEQSGAVVFDEADDAVNYGVVDEIARRVWLTGGRVLAVRRDDIPGRTEVAAILRYAV